MATIIQTVGDLGLLLGKIAVIVAATLTAVIYYIMYVEGYFGSRDKKSSDQTDEDTRH